MKKLLMLLAAAMMVAMVSCKKTDPTPEPTPDPPTPKSTACLITSLSVTSGDVTIVGQIFNDENYIELTYDPQDAAALADATATVVISDKATIDPSPASIKDWTKENKLTVTAEDGKTKKEYTVKPAPKQYTVSVETLGDKVVLTTLGAENDIAFFGGNSVAFCATDKIAMADGRVYDLSMNFIGNLNKGEIPADCGFVSLGNDDKGVLIGAVAYGDTGYSAAGLDGSGKPVWNMTNAVRVYAWKDGYDKAPVKLFEAADRLLYMNVSGDVNKNLLIAFKQNGNEGKHTIIEIENGAVKSSSTVFETGKAEIDRDRTGEYAGVMNHVPACWRLGQTAGSTLSPLGTTIDNAIFVYGQSLSGLSEEDSRYTSDPDAWKAQWGKDGAAGMKVAARNGLQGEDLILRGKAEVINGGTLRYGGLYGWGNVCVNGNVKAFNYGGINFVAVAGADWNEPNFTIVNLSASTEGETAYLLDTQGKAKELVTSLSSVAFVFNPATDKGEIVALFARSDYTEGTSLVQRITIARTEI